MAVHYLNIDHKIKDLIAITDLISFIGLPPASRLKKSECVFSHDGVAMIIFKGRWQFSTNVKKDDDLSICH